MQLVRVGILIAFVVSQLVTGVPIASAATSPVVISQVQVGNASSSRFVEIYNNSDTEVDVTGWCVRYVSAASSLSLSGSSSALACMTPASVLEHIMLPGRSAVLVGSAETGITVDYVVTGTMGAGAAGKVYVTNQQAQVVDVFGWGADTKFAEGTPKPADSTTKIYERRLVSQGAYVDDNNNATDFINSSMRPSYSIGALESVTDICGNIDGIQVVVPDDLLLGDNSECAAPAIDVCANIDGIQAGLPADTEVDNAGNCYLDTCLNLPSFQNNVPSGYMQDNEHACSLGLKDIEVTELLPNPEGEDTGNEFIEFYNPNDEPVDLTYHVFHLNDDHVKAYGFAAGTTIAANDYLVIRNSESLPSFNLTNAQGSVRLRTADSQRMVDVPSYINAASGESWAQINGVWQYTSVPTAGAENKVPQPGQGSVIVVAADCGEGRERNPETNRCRNIVVSSTLLACKEGQYRSEETNRCRSVALAAASVLKPCADNQFRNPMTNRCKTIASSDDLADCGEGRERNPETNRCRNVLGATSVPDSAFKVEPVKDSAVAFVGWWALGGIGLFALAYAGWEWRREIAGGFGSLVSRFSGKR